MLKLLPLLPLHEEVHRDTIPDLADDSEDEDIFWTTQKRLPTLTTSKTGQVAAHDSKNTSETRLAQQRSSNWLRGIVLVLALFVQAWAVFGMSFWAANLSKDSQVGKSAACGSPSFTSNDKNSTVQEYIWPKMSGARDCNGARRMDSLGNRSAHGCDTIPDNGCMFSNDGECDSPPYGDLCYNFTDCFDCGECVAPICNPGQQEVLDSLVGVYPAGLFANTGVSCDDDGARGIDSMCNWSVRLAENFLNQGNRSQLCKKGSGCSPGANGMRQNLDEVEVVMESGTSLLAADAVLAVWFEAWQSKVNKINTSIEMSPVGSRYVLYSWPPNLNTSFQDNELTLFLTFLLLVY